MRSRRCGRLRYETGLRHAGKRVRLQAIECTVRRHSKVDPRVTTEFEGNECFAREALHSSRLILREPRREFFNRHSRRVLAFVVVNLVLGDDFANGKRLVPKYSYGQLSSSDELLDHHFVVVDVRFVDRRLELRSGPHDAQPTVDPCLDGLTITGKPSVASTCSAVAGAISQSAVGTPAARKGAWTDPCPWPARSPDDRCRCTERP